MDKWPRMAELEANAAFHARHMQESNKTSIPRKLGSRTKKGNTCRYQQILVTQISAKAIQYPIQLIPTPGFFHTIVLSAKQDMYYFPVDSGGREVNKAPWRLTGS